MSEWEIGERITAEKLNRKTVYIADSPPDNPAVGMLWYDTANKLLKAYDGSEWKVTTPPKTEGPIIPAGASEYLTPESATASSSESGHGPENAIDEDTNTYWSAGADNAHITFDAGEVKVCDGCRIYWGASNRPSSYTVRVSSDGTSWETVHSSNTDPGEGWDDISWMVTSVRYVRVTVSPAHTHLHEFDFHVDIHEHPIPGA